MTKYLRPLLAVCTFVAVQAITCTVVYVLLILECMRETAARTGGSMFSASSYPNVLPELTVGNTVEILVVSSLVTLILLAGVLHLVRFPRTFDARSVHWFKVPAALVGSVAGILAVSLFSEFFDLPDSTGGSLAKMMGSMPGILAVGALGPILAVRAKGLSVEGHPYLGIRLRRCALQSGTVPRSLLHRSATGRSVLEDR